MMDLSLSKREKRKTEKRQQIIQVAEKLFLSKNYDAVTMDDVSKETGYSVRTIYQYFISKEDLFFAVALIGAKRMNSDYEAPANDGRNGLEKIRSVNEAYCRFFIENKDMFRLMNYQPLNQQNCEASPNYHELQRYKDAVLSHYYGIIEEGKSDGSIRSTLDTQDAVYFGFCSIIGLLNMVAATGRSSFWQNERTKEGAFLTLCVNLLTDAFKANPPEGGGEVGGSGCST